MLLLSKSERLKYNLTKVLKQEVVLAGVAHLVGAMHQRVAGLIPGQGTCLGWKFGP